MSEPATPLVNEARIVPAVLAAIGEVEGAGHGVVLNAGPVVRNKSPENEPSDCLVIDATSQMPWLLAAYVKSVAKIVVP